MLLDLERIAMWMTSNYLRPTTSWSYEYIEAIADRFTDGVCVRCVGSVCLPILHRFGGARRNGQPRSEEVRGGTRNSLRTSRYAPTAAVRLSGRLSAYPSLVRRCEDVGGDALPAGTSLWLFGTTSLLQSTWDCFRFFF